MHECRTILAIGFLAAFAAMANAEDKTKRLTPAECEKLVEQLVNPEKVPFTKRYVFPEEVSEKELLKSFVKVREAYNTLSNNCDVALPVLMKHGDDKRYSFVQEQPGSGVYRIVTVGSACLKIIDAHVQAHYKYTWCDDGEGRPRGHSYYWSGSGEDKSLADLQLEATEWVMKQEKPKFFKSEEAWKAALKKVETMADTIRKTRKAIEVEHRFHSIE